MVHDGLEAGPGLVVQGGPVGPVVVLAVGKRPVQRFLGLEDEPADCLRIVERPGASHGNPFLSGGSPALVKMTPRGVGTTSPDGAAPAEAGAPSRAAARPSRRDARSAVSTAALLTEGAQAGAT